MIRKSLLWASTNPFLAERLPKARFVRKATKRFMPGEEFDDVVAEAEKLQRVGVATTTTLLGENLNSLEEADAVVGHYLADLRQIKRLGIDMEVSVKPTQLGLDYGIKEARSRLRELAGATDSTVWLDMEASGYVDETLDMFQSVKEEGGNVGLCIQSYLKRTPNDVARITALDCSIRIVKGAYSEPASVAFPDKSDVDQAFKDLTETLLRARSEGGTGRVVLGTHDPKMIEATKRIASGFGLAEDQYEFAMLFGIQRKEQLALARQGHKVRVLISYGSAWFPWYMRRLAERPANLWFVAKQLVA
ncbi:proline dehydrogenase family protein [Gemmatimonadales bacterium]|nr:proline dehydrogenase family protein [Gemmatimonadales bacterium]